MSISSRIESIEGHIGDIYNTLELGGSDLTNTDKNIVNINSELMGRYKDYLANGTDELWNNWDKATETGVNEATLNNTIKAKMKMDLKGNTEQATRSGKNLFNINGEKTNFNTYIYKYTYSLKANTQYTVSSNCPESPTANIYANGTSSGVNNVDKNHSRTVTSDNDGMIYILVRHLASADAPGTFDIYTDILNGVYYLQLEEGSTATSYEEYGASPSPDYPSEIKNVKGKNLFDETYENISSNLIYKAIKVGDGSFTLSSNIPENIVNGASLFLLAGNVSSGAATSTNGVYINRSITQTSINGYVTIAYRIMTYNPIDYNVMLEEGSVATPYLPYNTVEVKVQNKNLFTGDFSQFDSIGGTGTLYGYFKLPNDEKSYSLSVIAKNDFTPSSTTFLGFSKNGGISTGGTTWIIYGSQGTITKGTKLSIYASTYRYVSIYSNTQETLKTFTDNFDIQLEEGSTASNYVAHQEQNYPISLGSLELCKIGMAQDYIYKENGKWYKHAEIGKVVLDGSETWYQNTGQTLTNTSYFYSLILDNLFKEKNALSNYFTYKSLWDIDETGIEFASFSYAGLRIRIKTSLANDVNSLKTWLSTHNTTVYYVLSTPTTTQITDTTLINQLNALEEAYSYNEQTNITQDGDLPFILDVTALIELS